MAKNNGILNFLKIIAVALCIAATAGALMRTYIVGPVKDTAVEAKAYAQENETAIGNNKEAIGDNKTSIAILEIILENTDENVERLMGLFGVPTVKEVPSGELTIDPPEQ